MEEKEKDVNDADSSDASESEEGEVEPETDKEKNFGKLREKVKTIEEENKSLKEKLAGYEEKEKDTRDLESKSDKGEEEESKKPNEITSVLFTRDKKKAIRKWNAEHQEVSEAQWDAIRGKVSLSGTEDDEEIHAKLNDVYESLPEVKQRREKEIAEKAKREALSQFSESEMDIGSGGEPSAGSKPTPRLTQKDKKWLNAFGVKPEEIKE